MCLCGGHNESGTVPAGRLYRLEEKKGLEPKCRRSEWATVPPQRGSWTPHFGFNELLWCHVGTGDRHLALGWPGTVTEFTYILTPNTLPEKSLGLMSSWVFLFDYLSLRKMRNEIKIQDINFYFGSLCDLWVQHFWFWMPERNYRCGGKWRILCTALLTSHLSPL